MALPAPAVTLYVPSSDLPTVLTRLTTYLLHNSYDFLQTSYATSHVEFEIFAQQHPLVHLTLRCVEAGSATSETLAPVLPSTLAADAVALIQHLLQK